jgi:hypothetical protein
MTPFGTQITWKVQRFALSMLALEGTWVERPTNAEWLSWHSQHSVEMSNGNARR